MGRCPVDYQPRPGWEWHQLLLALLQRHAEEFESVQKGSCHQRPADSRPVRSQRSQFGRSYSHSARRTDPESWQWITSHWAGPPHRPNQAYHSPSVIEFLKLSEDFFFKILFKFKKILIIFYFFYIFFIFFIYYYF